MLKAALLLIALVANGSLSGDTESAARAAAARPVLRGCGGVEAQLASQPDRTWRPRPDTLQEHAALRTALGEKMPKAASMILIFAAGGHLSIEQYSIILLRQKNGRWIGTAVGRREIGIQDAPFAPIPRKQWTLSPNAGQRLDQIIRNPCFYAEPSEFVADDNGPPPLGIMAIRLDVVAPGRRRSSLFLANEPKGLTAEVVKLSSPD
jgi:hypothetical protein